MKFICLGYGSIGRRHVANLRALRPNARVVTVDPQQPGVDYTDWREALAAHPAATAAIIASPTDCHGEQLAALSAMGIPAYVEKPLGFTTLPSSPHKHCAVGFQYRFHPAMPAVGALAGEYGALRFYARDDLLGRYGPQVGDIMAAHPIDTALSWLGPAERVVLFSDHIALWGEIYHAQGRVSAYDLSIGEGPRESWVRCGDVAVELTPDDGMYVEALRAWLLQLEVGVPHRRLATLADGLAVERVLAEVRYAHPR